MRLVLALALIACTGAARAETVIAARTLRAQTVIAPEDLSIRPETTAGALSDPAEALGLETRVTIYAGRPVRRGDLGQPALVERNQPVRIVFASNGLHITAEGRALARGAAGETIRVMNLASRQSVFGEVQPDGSVRVSR